jgi:hypothetical protein
MHVEVQYTLLKRLIHVNILDLLYKYLCYSGVIALSIKKLCVYLVNHEYFFYVYKSKMLILMTEEFYRFMLNCFKIHNIFTISSFISVLFPIKLLQKKIKKEKKSKKCVSHCIKYFFSLKKSKIPKN